MREAFANTLIELATQDPKIVFLTGDLGYKVFDKYKELFPKRFINAGVAEAQLILAATGLALEGYKPIVYSIASFMTARPYEHIRFCVSHHNLPIVIVGAGRGSLYKDSGYSHIAVDDIGLMNLLPNMNIVLPGSPREVRELLPQIVASGKPTYFTVGKYGEPELPTTEKFVLGKIIKVKEGSNKAIISVEQTTKLLDRPETIFHCNTIRPLDPEIYNILKTYDTTIIEDHIETGGLKSILRGDI